MMRPGSAQKRSQIEAPRPSASAAPSICAALVAAQHNEHLRPFYRRLRDRGKPAKVARQQFVRVGMSRGDFVAIDEGVTAGQEVVMLGAFKLRNGAPVMVNNQTTISPSQTPTPQNR